MRFGDRDTGLDRPRKPHRMLPAEKIAASNHGVSHVTTTGHEVMYLPVHPNSVSSLRHVSKETASTEESYLTTHMSEDPPATSPPAPTPRTAKPLTASPPPSPPSRIVPTALPTEISVPTNHHSSSEEDDAVSCITFLDGAEPDLATRNPRQEPQKRSALKTADTNTAPNVQRLDLRPSYRKNLDENVRTVQKQITASRSLIHFKGLQMRQLTGKINHIDIQRTAVEQELEASQQRLDTLQQEIKTDQMDMERIFAQIVALHHELEQKTKQLNQRKPECTALQQVVSKTQEELQGLDTTRDTLLAMQKACQEETLAAERKLANCEDELESLVFIQSMATHEAEF